MWVSKTAAHAGYMLVSAWQDPRVIDMIVEADHGEVAGDPEVRQLCGRALERVQQRVQQQLATQLGTMLDPAQQGDALKMLSYGNQLLRASRAGRVETLLVDEEHEADSQEMAQLMKEHGGTTVVMCGEAANQLAGFGGRVGMLRYSMPQLGVKNL